MFSLKYMLICKYISFLEACLYCDKDVGRKLCPVIHGNLHPFNFDSGAVSFLFWRVGVGFRDRVSLCGPGCPGSCSVDQVGYELRNLPASACQMLEVMVYTTAQLSSLFFKPSWVFILTLGQIPCLWPALLHSWVVFVLERMLALEQLMY